jgi:predicted DNA-binding transcriptional regulator AlpA
MDVNPQDLLDAHEVAQLVGLTNHRGVSVYRARYPDFPAPVIDKGNCVLWARAAVTAWASGRQGTRRGGVKDE